jgi:hypothetical protein
VWHTKGFTMASCSASSSADVTEIVYVPYTGEIQLPLITSLIEKELSEPYSVFTCGPRPRCGVCGCLWVCLSACVCMPCRFSRLILLSVDQFPVCPCFRFCRYRYFLNQWPNLALLAMLGDKSIGTIVCKLENHKGRQRGYIAMLAVDPQYRGRKIGSQLVRLIVERMRALQADEVRLSVCKCSCRCPIRMPPRNCPDCRTDL